MDSDATYFNVAEWPASHRAALAILIHVDAPDLGDTDVHPAVGLDYTPSGLQRLYGALSDLDVPATTAWTPGAIAAYPQLARSAVEAGHELAVSFANGAEATGWQSAFERVSDLPVTGCIQALPSAARVSASDGAGGGALDEPAWIVTGAGGDAPVQSTLDGRQAVTIIPVSPYWIDQVWLDPTRPLPPSSLLEAWSLGLAAVRTDGGLMTIVLHPHVSGRPGLASQIVRFLDEAIESGDVWIASASQIAAWWSRDGK